MRARRYDDSDHRMIHSVDVSRRFIERGAPPGVVHLTDDEHARAIGVDGESRIRTELVDSDAGGLARGSIRPPRREI